MQGNDTPPAVLKTANGSLAIERPCEMCGAIFLAPKVRAERGQARYCSRPCSGNARNRHVTCVCLTCGTRFDVKASAQARGEGLYCTPACYRAAIAGVERVPLAERFWSYVNKNGPIPEHCPEVGPCWVWTGTIQKSTGYGMIQTLNGAELAHRVSYRLNVGPMTLWALHKCDNRPCVRPDHLFEGNAKANAQDQWSKGRGFTPPQPTSEQRLRGEKNGFAKISDEDARAIFDRYAAGGITQRELAQEYGLHQTVVSRITRGVSHRHLHQCDS